MRVVSSRRAQLNLRPSLPQGSEAPAAAQAAVVAAKQQQAAPVTATAAPSKQQEPRRPTVSEGFGTAAAVKAVAGKPEGGGAPVVTAPAATVPRAPVVKASIAKPAAAVAAAPAPGERDCYLQARAWHRSSSLTDLSPWY